MVSTQLLKQWQQYIPRPPGDNHNKKGCSERKDSPNETIITQQQHNNQAKERS